jgi:hypothetical protein
MDNREMFILIVDNLLLINKEIKSLTQLHMDYNQLKQQLLLHHKHMDLNRDYAMDYHLLNLNNLESIQQHLHLNPFVFKDKNEKIYLVISFYLLSLMNMDWNLFD